LARWAVVKTCTKCVMPETAESLDFSEPVCSVCKQSEVKRDIDWRGRQHVLRELCAQIRAMGREYDCVVPFSGGKDSTFTLWYAVRELGLRCLVVRFDHGFLRQTVRENSSRAFRRLGVDSLHFTPNWKIVRKLMLESLRRRGDFCWHCHTGVFAYPMQVAIKWNVPLVIWGEGDNEYASWNTKTHDQERFDRVCSLGINAEDMAGMVDCEPRELGCFQFPQSTGDVRSIFLGDYVPWNPAGNTTIIRRELGWQGDEVEGVPPQYDYDKIECAMQGARDYIKYLKRGFGRTAHLTSIDIRNGLMSREEAIKLCEEYDGKRPASLDHLLSILELSEPEFLSIVADHVVYPHIMEPGPRANRTPEDIAGWQQ
jgi:N-acetyl sugar amidotransferase